MPKQLTRIKTAAGIVTAAILLTVGLGLSSTTNATARQMDPLVLQDTGLTFSLPRTGATVGDALRAASVAWRDGDLLFPGPETPLAAADRVLLRRQRTVTVRAGAETPQRVTTVGTTVGSVLTETGITLGPLDRAEPHRAMPLPEDTTIVVTRITEETKKEQGVIPPPLVVRADPSQPVGAETVDDPGAPGRAELTVRIRTENGHVAHRAVLARTVTDPPRPRRLRRGTKRVVLGAETGWASWYTSPTQTAAHRVLPLGTKLRIVRVDTGRATVVRVADRGPFRAGRVVDLSPDAFRALAPLGTGTIPVRVERLP